MFLRHLSHENTLSRREHMAVSRSGLNYCDIRYSYARVAGRCSEVCLRPIGADVSMQHAGIFCKHLRYFPVSFDEISARDLHCPGDCDGDSGGGPWTDRPNMHPGMRVCHRGIHAFEASRKYTGREDHRQK
jgi:hypothetical protein